MANQYSSPPDLTIDLDKGYTATLDTNRGEIVIEPCGPALAGGHRLESRSAFIGSKRSGTSHAAGEGMVGITAGRVVGDRHHAFVLRAARH